MSQWKRKSVHTYNGKNEHKKGFKKHYIYLKRQRGTNDFLWISESHLGSAYVCPLGLR